MFITGRGEFLFGCYVFEQPFIPVYMPLYEWKQLYQMLWQPSDYIHTNK